MAIAIPSLKDTFEVVSKIDDALDMTEEEFAAYTVAYNKALLKLKPGTEPTVFVMRKVIPFQLKNQIISAQRQINAKQELKFDFASTTLEVKASLVNILNGGEALRFSKDSDGSASERLMEILMATGIADELWIAYKTMVKDSESVLRKK